MIHFVWIGDKSKNNFKSTPKQWERHGYTVKEWDEPEILQLFNEGFGKIKEHYLKLDSIIKRADFARILVLIKHGGYYLDYDIEPHNGKLPKCTATTTLVMEHQPAANGMPLVANGIIRSRQEYNPFLVKFLMNRCADIDKPVLDYLGPNALTDHLNHWKEAHKVSIIPAQLMLWEDQHGQPPNYVIARHRNACSWGGDRTKQGWHLKA